MKRTIARATAAILAPAIMVSTAYAIEKPAVHSMTIQNGALEGSGGALILERLPDAQFILIGEDHGFADPPEIALAIARAARPYGVVNHVAEVGPHSSTWVEKIMAAGGPDDLAKALDGRPLALPFLNMREDAALADYFIDKARRRSDAFWGVDQEFIGSPLILLEMLGARAKTDSARSLTGAMLAAEREAFATAKLGAVFMSSATPEQFAELESAFIGDKTAMSLIKAMEESSAIYRSYNSGLNYKSNADRIALMRRQFLADYGATKGAAPRALFKFGAIHLAKGTTSLNTFDLGSLTEGVAAANGLGVLRILVLPLGGKQTRIMPSPDGFFSTGDVDPEETAALLEAIGVEREDIAEEGYSVIDLEPVRRNLEQKGLTALANETRYLVLGYDFLVTTRNARAATPLAK